MTTRDISKGAPVLESIEVSPAAISMAPGEERQFEALAVFSGGLVVDVTESVIWSSTSDVVATVDAIGLVRAGGGGVANVLAALGPVVGSSLVTINGEPLDFISFRRTIAQPTDDSDFRVTLPITLATNFYAVRATVIHGSTYVDFTAPDGPGDRTTTDFRLQTSASLSSGDVVELVLLVQQA